MEGVQVFLLRKIESFKHPLTNPDELLNVQTYMQDVYSVKMLNNHHNWLEGAFQCFVSFEGGHLPGSGTFLTHAP